MFRLESLCQLLTDIISTLRLCDYVIVLQRLVSINQMMDIVHNSTHVVC